jgi:c-di-GMP-related signal transduction protein
MFKLGMSLYVILEQKRDINAILNQLNRRDDIIEAAMERNVELFRIIDNLEALSGKQEEVIAEQQQQIKRLLLSDKIPYDD